MRMLKNVALIAGCVAVFSGSTVLAKECAPAWCQSSSLSSSEKVICGDNVLRAADALLAHTYTELMSFSNYSLPKNSQKTLTGFRPQ